MMPSDPAEPPGIGRYELLAKLGEGGMGVVHLARGPDGRRVALKVLRSHVVGDEEGRSRLAREVTTLRRVRSPRIAEVYDADPWGERPFVVTRYVPGPSLHDHVRAEGPLADLDVRFLALGLAEAMVVVHEAGVLHRDIKPSNVLLEGRAPVLIDFGLAKLADDSRLTVTGWLMGTPGYLAPEVLYGDDPTTASDVHAWAATVVFAASGTSPYGGGPPMAVMDRARLGEHDVSALPADLRPLIARSLSAEPAARPSGPELLARLARLQAAPTGQPRPALTDSGPMTAPMHPLRERPADPRTMPPAPTMPPAVITRPFTVPVTNQGAPLLQRPPTQPPQPQSPPAQPPAQQYEPVAVPPAASSGVLRAMLVVGAGLVVAAGVGLAPYVTPMLVLVVVWLVRTASVSSDALHRRRALRGPRRSDGFVGTLAWPWHLFVAAWGSVALAVAAAIGGAGTAALATFLGQPAWRCVLFGGMVFALATWAGPGSGRLRHRIRRVVWTAAAPSQVGVAWVLSVWLAAVVLLVVRTQTGVIWTPAPGPPFDVLPGIVPPGIVPPGVR
ncbi:MAG TPA: serine/threonine-protein kinase [Nocardioidaceae bacterium]|nr:serine/threonine-protein kinase [Nocardioidaceae bacterium]